MRINPNLFNDKGRIRLGSGYPTSLKWHPLFAEDEEYRYLAVSYSTGEIKLFRADQGDGSQTVNLVLGHVFSNEETDACNHVDWSSDGQYLLGVYGRRIRKFDVYTNLEVFSFFGEGHGNYVAAAGFSPDGRYIASATKRALLIHEAGRGKAVNFSLELGKTDTITSVNYSPDGRHIAAGSRRGRVTLFEAATGNIVDAFKADRDPNKDVVYDSIRHVCFSPDGRCIASISTGNGIILRETASANRVGGFDGDGHRD
ncbi:MAG: hypothetical protein GY866_08625, partial [Proteobacteria bacterium]|nr:hypothetical protein [Pseudomonadota bacterium]